MPFGASGNCHHLARHSSDQPGHRWWRLFDSDDRPVIFADSSVRNRTLPSPAAGTEIPPLSILASLLTPFAGARAERTAGRLLARFGSVERALTACDEQLLDACKEDRDIGTLITAAKSLVLTALRETVIRSPVASDDVALHSYLKLRFRGRPHEELHAIFVDHAHGFLSEELVAIGDGGHVQTRIRPILRRAIELEARGFLLVHNHPSRHPAPSREDISSTRQIARVANALDLTVFDHLIVAGNSVFSMREAGLL